ncbi:hypothetical protein CAC42_6482 [Sphaceloma murrayae]|uniref:Uncharacterized protein n=1 Tax=Sphaceloma murrayae TaxID=2082308 RepID=A0A2K1QGE9_9PEZI|nr:hypothetical protein CAC42_6482 [Sphaceloma murrayae]
MLSASLRRLRQWRRPDHVVQTSEKVNQESTYEPNDDDYPTFPPPPPKVILDMPGEYWSKITKRRFGAPRGVLVDSPLYALYRLYEFILLDKRFDYRNALEAFWRQSDWSLDRIPDPKDEDPARYAFLAGCTYLLVRSFNARVKIGLQRGMSALMTPEEAEVLRSVPDELRRYEKVPEWAASVPSLTAPLTVPTADGGAITSKDDERADPDFLSKNILLWTPHIHFT